jgi:hypothetical protein
VELGLTRNAAVGPAEAEPEPPEPDRREFIPVAVPRGTFRYDHALTLVCRSAKIDLVADYFTRGKPVKWNGGQPQLREVVAELRRDYGLRHRWIGTTLMVRTQTWAGAVDMEPTAEVVARSEAAAARAEGPALGDLLSIAGRSTDEKLTVLGFHMSPDGKRLPAESLPRIRVNAAWLRAFGALTRAEVTRARSTAGLNLVRLPVKTRAAWEKGLSRSSIYFPPAGAVVLKVAADDAPPAYKDWSKVPKVSLGSPTWRSSLELWQAVNLY